MTDALKPIVDMTPGEPSATAVLIAESVAVGLSKPTGDEYTEWFVSLAMIYMGHQICLPMSAEQADRLSADLAILAHRLRTKTVPVN